MKDPGERRRFPGTYPNQRPPCGELLLCGYFRVHLHPRLCKKPKEETKSAPAHAQVHPGPINRNRFPSRPFWNVAGEDPLSIRAHSRHSRSTIFAPPHLIRGLPCPFVRHFRRHRHLRPRTRKIPLHLRYSHPTNINQLIPSFNSARPILFPSNHSASSASSAVNPRSSGTIRAICGPALRSCQT